MNAAENLLGAAALERHGKRVALVCGEASVTYAELAAEAARASAALAGLGVRPGDRVLLLMRDTPEFAAAWLGAVRAGAIAVALNNKSTEAEYRHILADGGARLVLIEERFAQARPDLTAELAAANRVAIAGSGGEHAWGTHLARARPGVAFAADAEAPAFCLYSSGTTGRPKGILHSHRAFASLGAAFRAFGVGSGARVLTTSKLFFAYGLEHGLLAPLAFGCTSLLYPDWPDEDAVIGMVARHRPAAFFSVPTVYRRLLARRAQLAPFCDVPRFVAGGERLSPQLVAQWRSAVGGEILNLYGMSETFCACIVTPPGASDGLRTGLPLDGVELRLCDTDGAPAREGEPGVLWVRHPAQARGYANLPEQTRAQFHDGWFCTRDVFVRDAEGYYIHQGRSDELVKIAGQWVQPAELEEAAGTEAAVGEAACVAVADADGLERLALFVTARRGAAAAEHAAMQACERLLPRFKRPKWVRAVDELPRTATGKVQRFKLREILERELSGKE